MLLFFVLIIFLDNGGVTFLRMIIDQSFEDQDHFNMLFSGFFRVYNNIHLIYEFSPFLIVIGCISVANKQIVLKDRSYIYNIGRNSKFLERYFLDTVKRALLFFSNWYLVYLIIALVSTVSSYCFSYVSNDFIYGDDIFLSIFSNNAFLSTILLVIIMPLPVLIFTVLYSLNIVLLGQIMKNKIYLFSCVILYFFILSSFLHSFNIVIVSPIMPISYPLYYSSTSYIFALVSLIVPFVFSFILWRAVNEYDKI